jgi:uncharacterized membrane protein YesL
MAGIFGFFDYTKPGPGIAKDAPQKSRFVVFFEIFSRKFWNLVKINMMFTIFNLPAILAVLFVSQVFIQKTVTDDIFADFVIKFILGSAFLCIPLVTVGPAQAGFTYLLRNYAREEHAFIWSDFKEHAMKNFKESIIICLIDLAVVLIVGIDINIYMKMQKSGILTFIATAFLTLSFVIYLMMHMYIYPMLVTFKLSIKEIYKNALIFSIIKFLPNLGILAISFIILFVTFYSPIIGFILFPVITLSTIGLLTNFYVYPKLKKYMMDKMEQQGIESNE